MHLYLISSFSLRLPLHIVSKSELDSHGACITNATDFTSTAKLLFLPSPQVIKLIVGSVLKLSKSMDCSELILELYGP